MFKPGNPGGGRPKGVKNKSTVDIKELIDKFVSANDWGVLIQGLRDRAQKGDDKSAKLLMEYRFGKPVNFELGGPDGNPIEHRHTFTADPEIINAVKAWARAATGG